MYSSIQGDLRTFKRVKMIERSVVTTDEVRVFEPYSFKEEEVKTAPYGSPRPHTSLFITQAIAKVGWSSSNLHYLFGHLQFLFF